MISVQSKNFFSPVTRTLKVWWLSLPTTGTWLVDGLMEQGYPLHLANTLAIQQYNGIKYTNDQTDACYLAHLLRLEILPTGFIYPKPMRAVCDLLRRRLLLVKQKTAQLLSLQSTISCHSRIRLSSIKMKQLTPWYD